MAIRALQQRQIKLARLPLDVTLGTQLDLLDVTAHLGDHAAQFAHPQLHPEGHQRTPTGSRAQATNTSKASSTWPMCGGPPPAMGPASAAVTRPARRSGSFSSLSRLTNSKCFLSKPPSARRQAGHPHRQAIGRPGKNRQTTPRPLPAASDTGRHPAPHRNQGVDTAHARSCSHQGIRSRSGGFP